MCNKSIPKKNIDITSEAAIISTKIQWFQNSHNLAGLWSFTTSTTNCKGRLLSMPILIAFFDKKTDEPSILQTHGRNSAALYFVHIWNPANSSDLAICRKDCVLKRIIELNKLAQACIKKMQKHTKYEHHKKRTNSI